jgi:hypothetical protein
MPSDEALRIAGKIEDFMDKADRSRESYKNAIKYFDGKRDNLRESQKKDLYDALGETLGARHLARISNEILPSSVSEGVFRTLASYTDPRAVAAIGRTLDAEGFVAMARHLDYVSQDRAPTNNAYFQAFVSNRSNKTADLAAVAKDLGYDSHANTILEYYVGRERSPDTRQSWSQTVPSAANIQGTQETFAYVPWSRQATNTQYLANPATANPLNPGSLNPDYIEHDPTDPHITADQYVASRNAYQTGLPAGSQTKTYTKLGPDEFQVTNFRQGGQTFDGQISQPSQAPTMVVFGHGNDVTGTPDVTGSLYARGGSLASESYDPKSMYGHLMGNPTYAIQGTSEDPMDQLNLKFAACHTADPVENSFGTGVQEQFQNDGRTYEIKGQQEGDYKLKGKEGEMTAGLSRRSRSNSAVRTGHKDLVPVQTRKQIKAQREEAKRQEAKREPRQRGSGRDRVVVDSERRGRHRGGPSH